MKEVKIVYRIWDKQLEKWATAYSRAYHDEIEWDSKEDALNSNIHGIFKNESRYEIKKIKVTHEEVQ